MKLRFTIRDLLWLVVVVALAVGWWADHRRQEESHALLRLFLQPTYGDKTDDELRKLEPELRQLLRDEPVINPPQH
jgi:hypothetical protein